MKLKIYNHTRKGNILTSWSQRRCKKCQRFLSDKQHLYCKRCGEKVRRKQRNTWSHLRNWLFWNINKIKVGDYV